MELPIPFSYVVLFLLAVILFAPALLKSQATPIPMSGPVAHVSSEADFDALLGANTLVVADFYADWCGPCRAIAPLYGRLAEANAAPGRLAFAKINVDGVPAVAKRYGVSAMPTFLFFAEGERTALPVPGVGGGGAQVTAEGAVSAIRGADARALTAVAEALGKLARHGLPEEAVRGGAKDEGAGSEQVVPE